MKISLCLSLTLFLFTLSTKGSEIKKKTENDGLFKPLDLLIVNGDVNGTTFKDDVVLCMDRHGNHTNAMLLLVFFMDSETKSVFQTEQFIFPNSMLRPLSMKWKYVSLSKRNQHEIECVCNSLKTKIKWLELEDTKRIPLLCFGMIAKKFGVNGFYFLINHLFEEPTDTSDAFYNEFYYKYLKFEHYSLANSAIANNVRAGDLVRIRALKLQKNESLQMRALHLGGSFGRIITFTTSDLLRDNSRNQTEFAVQSLFDKRMKLALRPKYLGKITKVYVHRLPLQFPFVQFRRLMLSLLSRGEQDVLYLPHKIQALSMDEYAIFMLQQRERQTLIFDVGVSAANGIRLSHLTLFEISHQILSFPFIMNLDIWQRVITKMKTNSNPTKMIKKISGLFESINAKFMKMQLDKNQNVTQMLMSWRREIESSLSKFAIKKYKQAYDNLFECMTCELLTSMSEQHPDYLQQYISDQNMSTVMRLRKLYRTSVIQNYLRANANGRDLHVICYEEERRGFLRNLKPALAANLNLFEGNRNGTASNALANNIVQFHRY